MPAASALARLIPTALGGAIGSCGNFLIAALWPEAWGGPLRSSLATVVIGCLLAGLAMGMTERHRSTLRGLLVGIAAGCTGLGLLATPGVTETTAWRGVFYLAVTAATAVAAMMLGMLVSRRLSDEREPERRDRTERGAPGSAASPNPDGDDAPTGVLPRSPVLPRSSVLPRSPVLPQHPDDPDAITTPLPVAPRPVPHARRPRTIR